MNGHRKGRIDSVATVAMLATLACWTTGPTFIHYLSDYLDPYSQSFWRYLLAALIWLPYLLIKLRSGRVDRRLWKRALLPAAANVAMQTCWVPALYYIQPGFGSLITQVTVLWTAVFSFICFADERVLLRSKWFWSGLSLSLLGVAGVVAFGSGFSLGGSWKGIVLAQIAAFMWSIYTVSARWTVRDIDTRQSFSVISIYSMIGMAVIAILFGEPGTVFSLGAKPWAAIVISATLSIALAHVLFYTVLKRIGAAIPSLLLLSTPIWVSLVSYFWFDERLTAGQMAAGVVLLIGAGLTLRAQKTMVRKEIE